MASGDVDKAAAVTEAVSTELECMRKDAASINVYCRQCENKSEPRPWPPVWLLLQLNDAVPSHAVGGATAPHTKL